MFYSKLMRGAVLIRKTKVEETKFKITFQGKDPQLRARIFMIAFLLGDAKFLANRNHVPF